MQSVSRLNSILDRLYSFQVTLPLLKVGLFLSPYWQSTGMVAVLKKTKRSSVADVKDNIVLQKKCSWVLEWFLMVRDLITKWKKDVTEQLRKPTSEQIESYVLFAVRSWQCFANQTGRTSFHRDVVSRACSETKEADIGGPLSESDGRHVRQQISFYDQTEVTFSEPDANKVPQPALQRL